MLPAQKKRVRWCRTPINGWTTNPSKRRSTPKREPPPSTWRLLRATWRSWGRVHRSCIYCLHLKTMLFYKKGLMLGFLFSYVYNNFDILCLLCGSILLKAGADVNSQDYDGWTPLHAAAHWGQEEACKTLVDHMCDMQIKNNGVSHFTPVIHQRQCLQ